MKKKIISVLLVLMFVFSFCGCEESSRKTIVLVTDETGVEGSFYNAQAYSSLTYLAESYSYNLTVITPKTIDEYESSVEKAALMTPALIIVSSPKLELETILIAMQNPTLSFCLFEAECDLDLNGVQDISNVYSVMFDRAEEGFLSGVCAGSIAKSIMLVCDYEYGTYVEYEAGFLAGVKCVSPDASVSAVYIDPTQRDEEYSLALETNFAKQSPEVIYTVTDDERVLEFSAQKRVKLIATAYDVSSKLEENSDLLQFYVKEKVDTVLNRVVYEFFQGMFKGQIRVFGVDDEALVTVSLSGELMNAQVKTLISTYYYALHENSFTPPATRAEFKKFTVPKITVSEEQDNSLSGMIKQIVGR